ncbi:MAG: hypothetical protein R3E79_47715 [Caldilineaceae bacterium]
MSTQVYGAVNRNGSVLIAGSGDWTAQRMAAGTYEVTFTTPFAIQPVVVVSGYIPREQGGSASDNTFSVGPIKEGSFMVRTYDVVSRIVFDKEKQEVVSDNAGEAQDSEFTFIAIGGR